MLTKVDLQQIRDIVQDVFRPLDLRLEAVERRLETLESRMGSLESRMGSLESRIETLESEIADLKLETRAIHEIISGERKEFEERIEKVEKRLTALSD